MAYFAKLSLQLRGHMLVANPHIFKPELEGYVILLRRRIDQAHRLLQHGAALDLIMELVEAKLQQKNPACSRRALEQMHLELLEAYAVCDAFLTQVQLCSNRVITMQQAVASTELMDHLAHIPDLPHLQVDIILFRLGAVLAVMQSQLPQFWWVLFANAPTVAGMVCAESTLKAHSPAPCWPESVQALR